MNSVTVRVPASTSNLGSGFDTLGVALKLYNKIALRPREGRGVRLVSPIDESDRPAAMAMISEAAQTFFRAAGMKSFGFDVALLGEVPVARGLGSSVTVRLGVIAGLNEMTAAGLSNQQILDAVTSLEHHPDNAAPALHGGFTVAGMVGKEVRCVRIPVKPKVKFVALIPQFEINTEKARELIPQSYSKADTIHALNRTALISAAFATGNIEMLRGLFDDRVHQPYRSKLLPQLTAVIRAGEKAGAIGGWLSGSGSTIICLTLEKEGRVAKAMLEALPDSDLKILTTDNRGLAIQKR